MTDRDNVIPLTQGAVQSTEEMNERVEQARLARQAALGAAIDAHDRYMSALEVGKIVSQREKREADYLDAVAKNLDVSQRIGRATYHPATPTKAAMLENAEPRFTNIRDGVKADRQDYTILAIALALGAAVLIAWLT